MQSFIDFLSFNILISPSLLLIMYYFGAVGIPIMTWLVMNIIRHKYPHFFSLYTTGKQALIQISTQKQRLLFWTFFVMFFIFAEIMWRMMFEFLIAYFQIRDALTVGI